MTIPNGSAPPSATANGYHRANGFFEEHGIWQEAPVLIGTTNFEPRPDVKNIMITGGAGFIACWLVRHLTLTYPHAYNIVSFDKLDYCSSLNNTRILNDRRNFTFYQGDVTNPSEVVDCLERHNIDTIFHFAAQSHVDLSFGNSYSFTHTNVYGTHVLLEGAKKVGVRRFIHISTDEVYGEVSDDDDDLLESSILAPTNPYAASKAAAEMLVHSYQKSFKLPAIIVRSNNVYGPHQYPEKIIPKFTCLLARSRPVVLHGDGSPTRRYLYAGDAADAFDTILHRGQPGQVYNVGSHDEISNLALAKRILAEMGILTPPTTPLTPAAAYPPSASSTAPPSPATPSLLLSPSSSTATTTTAPSSPTNSSSSSSSPTGPSSSPINTRDNTRSSHPPSSSSDDESSSETALLRRWIRYTHDRPFNDHRYAVDATKLHQLGWRPRTSFDAGLRATVAWYRRFGERWWGDISKVLSPFPVVVEGGREVRSDHEPVGEEPLGRRGGE